MLDIWTASYSLSWKRLFIRVHNLHLSIVSSQFLSNSIRSRFSSTSTFSSSRRRNFIVFRVNNSCSRKVPKTFSLLPRAMVIFYVAYPILTTTGPTVDLWIGSFVDIWIWGFLTDKVSQFFSLGACVCKCSNCYLLKQWFNKFEPTHNSNMNGFCATWSNRKSVCHGASWMIENFPL